MSEVTRILSMIQQGDPNAAALGGRAEVYTRTNRHAEALADLDRLLTLTTGSEQDVAGFARAATLARLGRYQEAIAETERLAIGDPASAYVPTTRPASSRCVRRARTRPL